MELAYSQSDQKYDSDPRAVLNVLEPLKMKPPGKLMNNVIFPSFPRHFATSDLSEIWPSDTLLGWIW